MDGLIHNLAAIGVATKQTVVVGAVVMLAVVAVLLRAHRTYARRRFRVVMIAPAAVFFIVAATAITCPALVDLRLLPYAAVGVASGFSLGLFATGSAELHRDGKGFWYRTDPYVSFIVLLVFVTFLALRLSRLGLFTGQVSGPALDWSPWVVLLRSVWVVYFATYAAGAVCRALLMLKHERTVNRG